MKRIPLTQGKFAIVDNEDFEWLNQWKWFAKKGYSTFYAVRNISQSPYLIRMHRQILGLTKGDGKETDHINHNGLDNRQDNLRLCTHTQQQQNRQPQKVSSKFKGVGYHKKSEKWMARITYLSKRIYLGLFDTEKEAAKSYNKISNKLFGEFALKGEK